MTRLGAGILVGIVAVIAAFVSMTSFGVVRIIPHAEAPPPVAGAVPARLVVPVRGVGMSALASNWGDPRDGGARAHHGLDIMAAQGTSVIAAGPGRVERLFDSVRGGRTIYIRAPGGGWSYYYAHLSGYAPDLAEGQHVAGGEAIGYVGDTGDAGPGNFHLHFGISRMRPGDRWWQGEPVDPYPILASGRLPG